VDAPATRLTFDWLALTSTNDSPKISFVQAVGLARSLLMYYLIPGRHKAWRNFYKQFVGPDDLSFDIGAHIGNRTRALAAIGSRVVMLEPQQICQPVLRNLAGRNPAMRLLNKAVGAKKGKANLLVSQAHPTVSSLSEKWVKQVGASPGFSAVRWEANQLVEVITLDTLIDQFGVPKYCKLDVEGYEYEALLGLNQPIEIISFEYIPAAIEVALDCIKYLAKLGSYQFNIVEGERPRFSQSEWMKGNEIGNLLLDIDKTGRAGEVYARLELEK